MRLIDRVLPYPDFALRHAILIEAPAATVRHAITTTDVSEDALMRILVSLRRLPGDGLRGALARKAGLNIAALTPLVGHEYGLAFGLVGRFWHATPEIEPMADLAAFDRFDRRGFAKLVVSFELTALTAQRTMLSTSTHVRCDDARTWLAVGLYWAVIRPGIGLVRRRHLRQIKRNAEVSNAIGGAREHVR